MLKHINANMLSIKRSRYLLLLLLPGFVFFVIFKYWPMYGIVLAFKNFDPTLGILKSPWVGLRYFQRVLNNSSIWRIVFNTVKFSASKIVFGFPMPIIFALLLNEIHTRHFKRVVQTISYLPHFLSWVVISGLIFQLLSPSYGLYGFLAEVFGFNTQVLLAKGSSFYLIIILSEIWKEIGYGSIIYLAAIVGISSELYEAAKIDGAGRFKQVMFITLPGILPTICILFILRMGGILDAGFDQIFNLYNTAVMDSAEIIDTYVYKVGLERFEYSFATAVGLMKSLVAFVFVFGTNFIVSKFSESTIW